MRFIEISKPGGAEVMHLAEGPVPVPGPGQVLVKVTAAGVNRLDILQRMGSYPPPPGAPATLGVEISGVVVSISRNCGTIKKDDRVCALVSGGGYAEYVLADAATCLPIPAGVSEIEAAALPESFFTVWSNVFDRADLQAGETFLVHGGTSGIGTTAIQLAKVFGATVFTTAGTDEKCSFCKSLGVDFAVNYRSRDFVAECLSATGNRGIDVILDMVGGDYLIRNIRVAANEGRIVMISALRGYRAEADLLTIMRKRLTVTGSTLRSRSVEFKQIVAAKLEQEVWPLLASKRVKPVIFRTFPLDQAGAAHRLMEASEHMGKIVLTMD